MPERTKFVVHPKAKARAAGSSTSPRSLSPCLPSSTPALCDEAHSSLIATSSSTGSDAAHGKSSTAADKTIDLCSSDDDDDEQEGQTERDAMIEMIAGRKFSEEWPVREKRRLLMDILLRVGPEEFVSTDLRIEKLRHIFEAFGKKEMKRYQQWVIRDIAPFLHDVGRVITEEYTPPFESPIKQLRSARAIMEFYNFIQQRVRAEKRQRQAARQSRRARDKKSAQAASSIRNLPSNFRYKEDKVSIVFVAFLV